MGRRANGEGTIYQRKDGRWEAAAYFLTTAGRNKRVAFYGKTREEAHSKLVAAHASANKGIPMPDRTWRLGDFLEYWLKHAKYRPLTLVRHERVVRLHLKPGLGKYRLNLLSVQTVQHFLDQLYSDTKSPAAVHQARKVLSAALTFALRQELLVRNVARLVVMPRYKPTEAEHWDFDETLRFLEAARSDPLYPAFVLLVLYGLRRGEVLGLRWCDVDFEHNILRIRQQVQRIDGELKQVALKTDSSEADEPLLSTARNVLVGQRNEQAAARLAAGARWQGTGTDDDLVFTTKSGRPVEPGNLYRSFLRVCEQHGLRRITPHGLRHGNATGLKNRGVHDRDIQAILRHNAVHTTRLYEHADMHSKRSGLEKVEQVLFAKQEDGNRCRQPLPSIKKKLHQIGEVISGGASQTRTGDTGLFRPNEASLTERFTRVNELVKIHKRTWLLGVVAVRLSRQANTSVSVSSWKQQRLYNRTSRSPGNAQPARADSALGIPDNDPTPFSSPGA
jgi:integrase